MIFSSFIFQSRSTATSIIVENLRFVLSITIIYGLSAGITLSVRISKLHNSYSCLFMIIYYYYDIRCAPSLSSSKSRLKTYLFRSVY